MAKVVWTDESIKQLVGIRDSIAKDNEAASTSFVSDSMDYVEKILSPFPEAGTLVKISSDTNDERVLVFRNYVIGYYIEGDGCYIAAVIHGRRQSRWTSN
jgi:plasmid stabilization system protein ParE